MIWKRTAAFVLLMHLLSPCLVLGDVWDTAEFSIRHGENPVAVLTQDFDQEIPSQASKELKATAVKGNAQVDRIVRTTLKADPNGLIIAFVPGATEVLMTTNVGAASQQYPLTIGGDYHLAGAGGVAQQPPSPLPWEGVATAVVGGAGELVVGNVVRDLGLPYSVPKGKTREVQVIFSEELENTEVTFSIAGGDADNGTATIVGNATLDSSGTITVQGGNMTEPGHAGNLFVVGKVDDDEKGRSAGFSVCAHPTQVPFEYAWDLDPEIDEGDMYWGVKYSLEIVSDQDSSDTGVLADLDKTTFTEHAIVVKETGWFAAVEEAATSFYMDTLDPQLGDSHAVGGYESAFNFHIAILFLKFGEFEVEQVFRFACKRCGIEEVEEKADLIMAPVIPASGFLIKMRLSRTEDGKFWVHEQTVGKAHHGALPGSIDDTDEHIIEIKDPGN